MDAVSTQTRVRTCSECQGDAEYFCKSHGCDICTQCSLENECGSNNFETKDHDLIVYRNKLCINLYQEICKRHPQSVYEHFCEVCVLPICSQCKGHETHKQSDLKTWLKRYFSDDDINLIKKILLYLLIIQPVGCQTFGVLNLNLSKIRTDISKRASEQKNRIDSIVEDLAVKHSCPKMKITIIKHIDRIQKYEHFAEYSATKPVHFLLHKKKITVPKKRRALHTSNVYMTKSFDKENVMELLAIRITEKEKKRLNLNELEMLKHVIKINRYPKQVTNILLDTPCLEIAALGVHQLRGRFDLVKKMFPIKPDHLDLYEKAFPKELKALWQMAHLADFGPFMADFLEMISKKDFRDELSGFSKEVSENKTEMKPPPLSEEDKIMFREYRKLLETMPQIANMFDPMMSQTLIGCSSFYL